VVISYGNETVETDSDLGRLFKKSYGILRFLGATGGLLMYHHERIPSRFNSREDVSVGPHMHCIVNSFIDPERVVCLEAQTGIVVKGMGRPDDLQGHVEYVLSHLGVPREIIAGVRQATLEDLNPALDGIMPTRLHTIRWFGSWCRLKAIMENGRFCPICGQTVDLDGWGRPIWLPLDRPPPDDEWIDGSETDWVIQHGHGYGE
jgi:predicted nucleic acid-binding Zn ribbon protein